MLTQELRNKIKDDAIYIKLEYLEYVLEPVIEKIFLRINAKIQETKPLLTIPDIAKRFKVTKATIHNWIKREIITGTKVGKNRYFTEDEVKEALLKYGFIKESHD